MLAPARMLGVGGRHPVQPRQDLPPPSPHRFRERRRVELFAQRVEPVRVAGARLAQERRHLLRRDAVSYERRVAGLEPQRHLPADLLQAPAELTDAPLAGVVADDAPAGVGGEPDRRGRQPGGPVLRAGEMRLGDGDLLVLGVPGQDDDLEPVAQGVRDAGRVVGGGDEQHLRQIEGDLDEGVAEAVVLGGVEDLEQDGGGRGAELVDLVEDEDGVAGAGEPQLPQDGAGLGIPPRAVVAAQVGLVVEPAAGELDEPAPERLGRAPGQRGSCRSRGKPSHTARYQGSAATIHYPFHPRSGERVEILRRHQRAGRSVLVIRQPDGTRAQVPTWMCEPAAAALPVKDRPRITLAGLRDLRLAVDAALSSFSGREEGERHETGTGSPARRAAGGDGAGTGAHGTDTDDGAPAGGDAAARGGVADRDQTGGSPGDGGKR